MLNNIQHFCDYQKPGVATMGYFSRPLAQEVFEYSLISKIT